MCQELRIELAIVLTSLPGGDWARRHQNGREFATLPRPLTCGPLIEQSSTTMREVWLRGNTRAISLIRGVAALVAGVSFFIAAALYLAGHWLPALLVAISGVFDVVAAIWIGGLHGARIEYAHGDLVLRLRAAGGAEIVPIEEVECFLLGRGPSFLPGEKHEKTETVTLVVRLRPQAEEYAKREVDPRFGSWCESNIIIRGTWCEPLTIELAQALNDRLVARQRELRAGVAR